MASGSRPIVGVSSCLLGELVRYDGKEKRAPWVSEALAALVEVISICPEVGAGMSIPRPPIQIVKAPGAEPRVRRVHDAVDVSDVLESFARRTLDQLEERGLDGYVFKARSPSCGLRDTPHFLRGGEDDEIAELGKGVWAAALTSRWPDLPVADEAHLQDEVELERFVDAVRAHHQQRSQRRSQGHA